MRRENQQPQNKKIKKKFGGGRKRQNARKNIESGQNEKKRENGDFEGEGVG